MSEKLGRKITLIVVFIVLAAASLLIPEKPFRLGLDLQGGTRLVYRFDFEDAAKRGQLSSADLNDKGALLQSFKDIILQRLDPKGVKEISIRTQGADQLVIELPGAADFNATPVFWKLGAALAADERAQLVLKSPPAENSGVSAAERIEAVEALKKFPLDGGTVRIGSENIEYRSRQDNVLRELKRGVDKTTPAAHEADGDVQMISTDELERIITQIGDLQFMIVAQPNDPELSRLGTDLSRERSKLDTWLAANKGRTHVDFNLLPQQEGGPVPVLRWFPHRIKRGEAVTPVESRMEGLLVPQRKEWTFDGDDLKKVEPTNDEMGYPAISLDIEDVKKSAFGEFTGSYLNRQMAILINGEIATAPVIQEKLPGSCRISGGATGFTKEEVRELEQVLESGSLRIKPLLLDKSRVGASLGQDYIETAVWGVLVALGVIVFFMLFIYRRLGLFSVVGLVLNLLFLLGALAFMRATVTLPGVAGILLTLGMAVDGNILIYERLREELARGLKLIQACKAAFERAGVTIIDSNLTTLIAGIILQIFGTGPIRGFAVTLNIGILTTLFTVIVVTEVLVLLDVKRGTSSVSMMKLPTDTKFQFLKVYKGVMAATWFVILGGVALFAALPREKQVGIDFLGGVALKVRTEQPMQVEDLRTMIKQLQGAVANSDVTAIQDSAADGGYTLFSITYKKDSAGTGGEEAGEKAAETLLRSSLASVLAKGPVFLTLTPGETNSGAAGEVYFEAPHPTAEIAAELAGVGFENPVVELLPGQTTKYRFTASVAKDRSEAALIGQIGEVFRGRQDSAKVPFSMLSPVPESNTIGEQVGQELRNAAVIALVLSLIGSMLYLRIRFAEYSYGVGVVVAVIHDVLMTITGLAIASWTGFLNAEINLAMIAVFLTIIGYSQNDTIVIFDRVRENRPKSKGSLEDVLNESINQTLGRTILTTSTVLLTLIVLFAFNYGSGNVLETFSFALIVGVISGCYSTIYIASPVLLWFERWQARRQGTTVVEGSTPATTGS